MDPLFFKHGFQLVWRIGDIDDAAFMKCMMLTGSNIAGSPGPTEVIAYAWVYTWEEDVINSSPTSLSGAPTLSTTISTTQGSDPPQPTHTASSADKIEINFIGKLLSLLVFLVIMNLRH
jgi:hypothetical protein